MKGYPSTQRHRMGADMKTVGKRYEKTSHTDAKSVTFAKDVSYRQSKACGYKGK